MLTEQAEKVVSRGGFVLGEYTTVDGPIEDDRFFVLISPTCGEEQWPAWDPEARRILALVSAHAGHSIDGLLVNSTKLDSRVLFPLSLRGAKMYNLVPVKRGWVLDRLSPMVKLTLTQAVSDYLQGQRSGPSRSRDD
jgi:hypothetical protein